MYFKVKDNELRKVHHEKDVYYCSLCTKRNINERKIDELPSYEKEEIKKLIKENENLEAQIEILNQELIELDSLVKEDLNKQFSEYLSKIKKENCFFSSLNNNLSTIKILDDFLKSGKEYLILKNFATSYTDEKLFYINLVITRRYFNVDADKSLPTMTEMRYYSKHYSLGMTVDEKYKRLNVLVKQIKNLKKIQHLKNDEFYEFDTYCLVGGQTSNNRSGYGCTWTGGGDYSLGTLYGEVTEFMAVGVILGYQNVSGVLS